MLYKSGFTIKQILSRHINHADRVAERVQAQAIVDFKDLDNSVDLICICVTDANIMQVANQLQGYNGLVVHTSGTVALSALQTVNRFGVFYPLQTFTKTVAVDFKSTPILVEANTPEDEALLENLARRVSTNVEVLSSAKREKLHVAAVIANNFTNHLLAKAYNYCHENNLPFHVLNALITETARKAISENPNQNQTGPAARKDLQTIQRHLEIITDLELKKLYQTLSESIIKSHETKL